jgi:uncharacterized membrane protein
VNTLSVWRFPAPEAAGQALERLEQLVADGRAAVDDAALVTWPHGRRTPATRELGAIDGPGRLWGGFWGMLLGLIFLTPLAGPAFGAAAGAIAGSLADFGVADDFVMRVRRGVTPGTSALFVLSSRPSADQLADELAAAGVQLLRSELSPEQSQYLQDTLADR